MKYCEMAITLWICRLVSQCYDEINIVEPYFYYRAPLRDMSIQEWLERKECNEDVIAVFEAMYCQTIAATPKRMGLCEAAREENAWQYGSGNYR